PHTVSAYRDTFRLLVGFVYETTGKAPSVLGFEDLDATVVGAFLDHLETVRHNSARTRNARLAAIRSLFRYAAFRHPEHAAVIARVLAIPQKRTDAAVVSFLTRVEIDALLAAPDRSTRIGRRDHAMILVAAQCGLRVSELTGLSCEDVHLGAGPHVTCRGKGRKQRATPLTAATVTVLRAWLREIQAPPDAPLFTTSTGRRLTRDAVARRLTKHAGAAARRCPSLAAKTISPHTLRHSSAMALLHAGVDTSVIALWLGHEGVESTQMYLHADLSIKERAIARTAPTRTGPGRYRPREPLLAFLEAL
ncbi:MAG: site-specific integrase, partial [Actinobacteria bacterium]|nr:site-specific integrase [Actinomycetota bacterium]